MFYNHGYCFSEKSLCLKRAHFRKIVWNTGSNHHQWTLNRCIKTRQWALCERLQLKVRTIFSKCFRALLNDFKDFELTVTFEHLYKMFFNHSCHSKTNNAFDVKSFPTSLDYFKTWILLHHFERWAHVGVTTSFSVVIWETKFSNVLSFFSRDSPPSMAHKNELHYINAVIRSFPVECLQIILPKF